MLTPVMKGMKTHNLFSVNRGSVQSLKTLETMADSKASPFIKEEKEIYMTIDTAPQSDPEHNKP